MIRFTQAITESCLEYPLPCSIEIARPVGIRHFCAELPGRLEPDGKTRRFMGTALYPAEATSGNEARLIDVLRPHTKEAFEILLREASPEQSDYLRETLPRLTLSAQRDAPICREEQNYPILIFNPGGEGSRAACLPLGEALAAAGYIVLAIEGVRDSPAMVFPDGEIVTLPLLPDESYITPRIEDARFVLDQLPELNRTGPLSGKIDLDRVGMLGHSRGGYLANITAVEDARIRAAVNMDGFLWGLWTDGTGLSEYPADFQKTARSLKTPILRLIGEQADAASAQARFAVESQDFGGAFSFAALHGFQHRHFASAPYLSAKADSSAAALAAIEEYRAATKILAPLLIEFFDWTLKSLPKPAQMKARECDLFWQKGSRCDR